MINMQTQARVLVILGIFLLMFPSVALNLCLITATCFTVLSAEWRRNFKIILENPVIKIGIVLVLFISCAVFYSEASWFHAYRVWDKYLKIFYFIFFLPLFLDAKWRKRALIALVLGVMANEILTYLHYFNVRGFPNLGTKHWLFVNDIDGSFVVGFVCYLLLNLVLDEKRWRSIYFIFFIICAFDLFILNTERTGYVVFISLLGLTLWQRWQWKGLFTAIFAIPIFVASLYLFSNHFHDRINLIVNDVHEYHQGNKITSIGLRMAFANYSFKIIKTHPILGAGTGSFVELYQKLNGPKLEDATWPGHPHNEYILIALQLGTIGISVFLMWICCQLYETKWLPSFEKRSMQGLICAFLVLSFCNASLYVTPAGILYVLFLAVFLGAKYSNQRLFYERRSYTSSAYT